MIYSVGFEVLTAVTMNNSVFWDVTSCGCCKNKAIRRHTQEDDTLQVLYDIFIAFGAHMKVVRLIKMFK
jgi:hypothetical protein